ncbi:MAG: hypothetical protein MJZ21_00225 [archaeon]|nr:hypothetical protein [archaeon]
MFAFKWGRYKDKVNLQVSDYIEDAPDIVLQQFLEGTVGYVTNTKKQSFGQEYMDYMTSDEFIISKRPLFMRRTKQITRSDIGTHRNLFDSVQRLLDSGLLTEKDIDNSVFTWSTGVNTTRMGYCFQLFRVVMISAIFDIPDVDEQLLDFVVYHECLHLRQGYVPFDHNPHNKQFKEWMRLFPNHDEMEKKLLQISKIIKSKKK